MVSEDRVSFLEMNTRLQVEHPVTEAVFGVDLVEQQIRVAEGHSCLPEHGGRRAGSPDPVGHAVEVRLYAEDPAADYQPQSGLLDTVAIAADVEFAPLPGFGIRVDSGFETGNEVGTHYDAMLAKVISWGPDRDAAFRALAGTLERARLHGVVTNRDLLVRLLRDERVLAAQVSTDFLDDYDLATPATHPGFDPAVAATAAALALAERDRRHRRVQRGIPVGWRNVVSQPQRTTLLASSGEEVVVEWYGGRDGYVIDEDTRVVEVTPDRVVLEVGGVMVRHDVLVVGDRVHVDSGLGSASYRTVPRFVDPAEQVSAGSLLAPMPGTVIAVQAESGAEVEAGQALLVLEAMKMQHTISAPTAGVLEVSVQVGQQVSAGDVLAVVTADESSEEGAEA
jgi:propionyl-CoA carboxylase alpha chain